MAVAIAAALVLLAAGASAAPLLSTQILPPVTHPLLPGMREWTTDLPTNYPFPGYNFTGNQPTQVHLAPAGPGSMYVMWATGNYTLTSGAPAPVNTAAVPSVVKFGASASALTSTASGTAEVYNQIYSAGIKTAGNGENYTGTQNYTSPLLHTVTLANLTGGATYFYTVGDGANSTSQVFSFIMPRDAGPTYPQRFITLADWGLSTNSTATLTHALAAAQNSTSPPVILYIGDFCYADTWYANGTASATDARKGFSQEGKATGTWQPVWDAWQRFIQPLVSSVPMLSGPANHEIEQQDDVNGTVFASVQARWKVPSAASGSNSYFFYSRNVGPAHVVFINEYVDYTPGSFQWQWLQEDLASVNRTLTPWVIVNFHNPWYSTDAGSYKQFEQMRVAMEPITYAYGVDVFYYGHVHAYERTPPVYNFQIDQCGAIHITIGDAGNSEGLSGTTINSTVVSYADTPGGCPNITTPRVSFLQSGNPNYDPFTYYRNVFTFNADGNSTGVGNPMGFCYKEQPTWSAIREPSFGFGTLDIVNATTALWQWHRNQDATTVVSDALYIVRNTAACPNNLGGNNPANAFSAAAFTAPVPEEYQPQNQIVVPPSAAATSAASAGR